MGGSSTATVESLENPVGRIVELALDRGIPVAVHVLGDQVDPGVAAPVPLGPLGPQPHVGEPVDPLRLGAQEVEDQPLELVALVPLVERGGARRARGAARRRPLLRAGLPGCLRVDRLDLTEDTDWDEISELLDASCRRTAGPRRVAVLDARAPGR